MKKKIITAVAAVAILAALWGAAVAASGSAGDPFVTLSYLRETFLPQLKSDMQERAHQGTAQLEQETLDKMDTLADSYLAQAGGGLYADTFEAITLARGDRLGLPTGASFQFEGGVCQLTLASGQLLDVTEGKVHSASSALAAGHRYIASDNTACTITAVSDSVYLRVRGSYMLDASGAAYSPFIDLCQKDWYYNYAIYAYERGLFTGTSDTTFGPTVKMNRAMLATVLSRLDGRTVYAPSAGFTDVPDGQWYTTAVNWAAANKIVTGSDTGAFLPNDNVTREQLCTMLYRYAKNYLGMDVSASADLSAFTDQNKISVFAREPIAWAVGSGIMTGSDTGALSPTSTATRGEVATMLQRFCNLID